mmetsp:Transcript_8936/g.13145  ORF Transcript_8936/g.13145 Transcript_8936/m.13145 type:complete len:150 (+) Transcript_8936:438-887(+)
MNTAKKQPTWLKKTPPCRRNSMTWPTWYAKCNNKWHNNNLLHTHNHSIKGIDNLTTVKTTTDNSTSPSMIGPTHTINEAETTTVEDIKTTTTTTTIRVGKVGTKEIFTVGPMEDAITQALTAKQRCRATKMKQRFKTKWAAVKEAATDG